MSKKQQGFVPLVLLIVIALILAIAYFLFKGSLGLPKPNIQTSSKQPSVSLKQDYQNPFDKNSQYVNPFAKYKNPFDTL